MAALGRLADLEFTDKEREQAKDRLQQQRANYRALRAAEVPFDLAPCMTFDPVPTGMPLPPAGPRASWQPRADVKPPAGDIDLAFASVDELAALLRARKVTSRKLTELCLARLVQFDPQLHCVITLLRDEALATADLRDRELAAGTIRSPLHGIPYGAKDLFAWPSAPTTFGAEPYRDHVWPLTATVLQKLHDAGAVLCAKLSLGALAMGDLWFGGRTRQPWNPERGSSGSSAGSASAVAAGLLPFAIGTETLGSIVSPCTQCGVGGLRPTFGTISRYGAMPLSWTMDKVGPIARSATDLALVFDTIAGADGKDRCARTAAFPWRHDGDGTGLRIGMLQGERMFQRPEDRAFLDWLRARGQVPRPIALPGAPYGALLTMLHAESAAAFDELTRSGKLAQLSGQGDGDWPNQFRAARAVPAVEFLRAARLRTRLQHEMAKVMADVDVLVTPTHGGPTLACTNLTGHPALVLPIGADDAAGGRPTVLTLIGGLYGEAAVLHLAQAWQRDTDWHRRRPALTR
ncbi:MAG: amidase [Planctomycetes bacterium]|nr:amidase [Planctomycetota bacterium]